MSHEHPTSERDVVLVCAHVFAGRPYNLVLTDEKDGRVIVAVCADCDAATACGEDIDGDSTVMICRQCARERGIPDRAPDGVKAGDMWRKWAN